MVPINVKGLDKKSAKNAAQYPFYLDPVNVDVCLAQDVDEISVDSEK